MTVSRRLVLREEDKPSLDPIPQGQVTVREDGPLKLTEAFALLRLIGHDRFKQDSVHRVYESILNKVEQESQRPGGERRSLVKAFESEHLLWTEKQREYLKTWFIDDPIFQGLENAYLTRDHSSQMEAFGSLLNELWFEKKYPNAAHFLAVKLQGTPCENSDSFCLQAQDAATSLVRFQTGTGTSEDTWRNAAPLILDANLNFANFAILFTGIQASRVLFHRLWSGRAALMGVETLEVSQARGYFAGYHALSSLAGAATVVGLHDAVKSWDQDLDKAWKNFFRDTLELGSVFFAWQILTTALAESLSAYMLRGGFGGIFRTTRVAPALETSYGARHLDSLNVAGMVVDGFVRHGVVGFGSMFGLSVAWDFAKPQDEQKNLLMHGLITGLGYLSVLAAFSAGNILAPGLGLTNIGLTRNHLYRYTGISWFFTPQVRSAPVGQIHFEGQTFPLELSPRPFFLKDGNGKKIAQVQVRFDPGTEQPVDVVVKQVQGTQQVTYRQAKKGSKNAPELAITGKDGAAYFEGPEHQFYFDGKSVKLQLNPFARIQVDGRDAQALHLGPESTPILDAEGNPLAQASLKFDSITGEPVSIFLEQGTGTSRPQFYEMPLDQPYQVIEWGGRRLELYLHPFARVQTEAGEVALGLSAKPTFLKSPDGKDFGKISLKFNHGTEQPFTLSVEPAGETKRVAFFEQGYQRVPEIPIDGGSHIVSIDGRNIKFVFNPKDGFHTEPSPTTEGSSTFRLFMEGLFTPESSSPHIRLAVVERAVTPVPKVFDLSHGQSHPIRMRTPLKTPLLSKSTAPHEQQVATISVQAAPDGGLQARVVLLYRGMETTLDGSRLHASAFSLLPRGQPYRIDMRIADGSEQSLLIQVKPEGLDAADVTTQSVKTFPPAAPKSAEAPKAPSAGENTNVNDVLSFTVLQRIREGNLRTPEQLKQFAEDFGIAPEVLAQNLGLARRHGGQDPTWGTYFDSVMQLLRNPPVGFLSGPNGRVLPIRTGQTIFPPGSGETTTVQTNVNSLGEVQVLQVNAEGSKPLASGERFTINGREYQVQFLPKTKIIGFLEVSKGKSLPLSEGMGKIEVDGREFTVFRDRTERGDEGWFLGIRHLQPSPGKPAREVFELKPGRLKSKDKNLGIQFRE